MNFKSFSAILLIINMLAPAWSIAQTLETVTKVVLNPDNTITRQESHVIQINNPSERFKGELAIFHDKEDKFKLLYADIVDQNDKVVKRIKKKEILTRSQFSQNTFYKDGLVKEVKLYWKTYPYKIRYAYQTVRKDFTFLAYWAPKIEDDQTPNLSVLTLEIPEHKKVFVDASDNLQYIEKKEEGKRKLRWELGKTFIPEREINAPSFLELVPKVMVTAENFHYGVDGDLSTWKSYGDWYLKLNEGLLELTESEKKKVDELIEGIASPKEKIAKLYHYLQDNTTYINVDIDLGGLQSYPASYVCENKYGDCKALTTYMKALLNYVDIPSNYILVDAGNNTISGGHLSDDMPNPMFNHIFLGVPLGQDTIFLENTSSTAPFGYVGTFIQNRKALWLKEEGSHLIDMPKLSTDDVLNRQFYNYTLDVSGKGVADVQWVVGGQYFEQILATAASSKESEIEMALKKGFNTPNFKLIDWKIHSEGRNEKQVILNIKAKVEKQIQTIGKMGAIRPNNVGITNFEKPNQRIYPVYIKLPVHKEFISQYDLSALGDITIDTMSYFIEEDFGLYRYEVATEEKNVIVKEEFLLKSGNYPLSEYSRLYQFIKSSQNAQKKLAIVFSKK